MIGKNEDFEKEQARPREVEEKEHAMSPSEADHRLLRPLPTAHIPEQSYNHSYGVDTISLSRAPRPEQSYNHSYAADTISRCSGGPRPEQSYNHSYGADHISLSRGPTHTPPATRDSEKDPYDPDNMQAYQESRYGTVSVHSGESEEEHAGDDFDGPKKRTFWILIYLSMISPLLSPLISIYTLYTTLAMILFIPPLYIVGKQKMIGGLFYQFLAPASELQLGFLYSAYVCHRPNQRAFHKLFALIVLNTCTPIYTVAIAIAAWISGLFWGFTALLGNPDGKDEVDDGRVAVLWVRGVWESLLITSVR